MPRHVPEHVMRKVLGDLNPTKKLSFAEIADINKVSINYVRAQNAIGRVRTEAECREINKMRLKACQRAKGRGLPPLKEQLIRLALKSADPQKINYKMIANMFGVKEYQVQAYNTANKIRPNWMSERALAKPRHITFEEKAKIMSSPGVLKIADGLAKKFIGNYGGNLYLAKSDAIIALGNTLNFWNPKLGAKATTFLYKYGGHKMIDLLRKEKRHKDGRVFIDDVAGNLADKGPRSGRVERIQTLKDLSYFASTAGLLPDEKKVLAMLVGGKDNIDIMLAMGKKNQSYASIKKRPIIAKLTAAKRRAES